MALSVDKFKFGNKSSAEMYFGTLSVKQLYFGNVLIWEKGGSTVRTLVYSSDAWDGYVYSYFTPTSDLDIKAVEAFTDIGYDSYTHGAWILDAETAMTIGYGINETATQVVETRYEQDGYSRIITFNDTVNLKANKKYIILFKRDSNDSTKFKLSYFDGEQRSEVITDTTSLPSTTVVDLTNETYSGVIDSSKPAAADVLNSFMGSSGLYRYDASTTINTNQSVNLSQYHYYKSNYFNVWKGHVEADGWYNYTWASPSLDVLKTLSANDVACTEKHDIEGEQNYGAFVFKRTDVEVPKFDKSVTIGGNYNISNLRNALLNELAISANGPGQLFLNTTDWTSWEPNLGSLSKDTIYSATSADYITNDLSATYSNPPTNLQEKYLYWYNSRIYQCVNGTLTDLSLNTVFHTVQTIDKSTLFTPVTDAYTNVGTGAKAVLTGSPATGKNYYYNLIKTDNTRVEV